MKVVNLLLCRRLLALSGLLTLVGAQGAVRPPAARKPAPAFSLKDPTGKEIKLADFRGKVVLLNFWATWCGPCKKEIPWFIDFQNRWNADGFTVLGASADDDAKDVVPFLKTMGMNYPVVMADEVTMKRYGGVVSLPSTFLIDREGRIAAIHTGLVERAEYEKDLAALLLRK